MGTMLATTILAHFVLRYRWRYAAWLAIAATGALIGHRRDVLRRRDAESLRRPLVSSPDSTPYALLHSLKHYEVLHERSVFLRVEFQPVPRVGAAARIECEPLADDCRRVVVRYGFIEDPNVPDALERCAPAGLVVELGTRAEI